MKDFTDKVLMLMLVGSVLNVAGWAAATVCAAYGVVREYKANKQAVAADASRKVSVEDGKACEGSGRDADRNGITRSAAYLRGDYGKGRASDICNNDLLFTVGCATGNPTYRMMIAPPRDECKNGGESGKGCTEAGKTREELND